MMGGKCSTASSVGHVPVCCHQPGWAWRSMTNGSRGGQEREGEKGRERKRSILLRSPIDWTLSVWSGQSVRGLKSQACLIVAVSKAMKLSVHTSLHTDTHLNTNSLSHRSMFPN